MNNKIKISGTQLLMMAAGSALMFPYSFMPIVSTAPANQDVWIVLFVAALYVIVLNMPALILMNRCRGLNINQISELILGKFLGKVICMLFALFFCFCFISCMMIAVLFVSIYVFPTTPTWAFLLYTLITVSYASFKGPAIIGRLAVLIVPFLMMTVIVFFLMGLDIMDIMVLKPVLVDSTLLELNQGGFINAVRFSEILIFLVFSFFLDQKFSINKTYARTLLVFFIFYALILFPTILVLGIDLAKNAFNPYFIFTRQAHSYGFIEKIQALNTLAWYPGMLLKLTLNNFMASYLLSGIFQMKSHRGFVIPVSILGFTVSLLPIINKTDTVLLLASDRVFPWIVMPIAIGVTTLLCVVYFIRRKKIDPVLAQMKTNQGQQDPNQQNGGQNSQPAQPSDQGTQPGQA